VELIRFALCGFIAALTACRGAAPAAAPAPSPAAEPSPAPAAKPKPAPAPAPAPAAPAWTITKTGIGDLQLGAPWPQARAANPSLDAQYTTTFYADAQPLEGFTLTDPPVFVVVTGGSFAKYGMDNPGEPAPAAIKAKAMKLARAGKLTIEMLVVTDPRVQTASGAFVSQDFAAFAHAYPNALRKQMPALWEEPSCVAEQEGVWFFFDHCGASEPAKIIRIVVRRDDS
jgi:hypothetical protein